MTNINMNQNKNEDILHSWVFESHVMGVGAHVMVTPKNVPVLACYQMR